MGKPDITKGPAGTFPSDVWKPKKQQDVSVVDFAVHPDYAVPVGRAPNWHWAQLQHDIIRRAHLIAYQGIMFYCIEHWEAYEKQREGNDPVANHVRSLRRILQNRLIVVPAEYSITNMGESVHGPLLQDAQDRAAEQGYVFDRSANAYAYGLTAGTCVPLAAQSVRKYFKFDEKVRVILGLTDFGPSYEGQTFADMQAGTSNHVEFQMPRHPRTENDL
jgi:hypothetical protein